MSYASNTVVPEDRSRTEIERALMRYGASRFGYMREERRAMIGFTYRNISVQMIIPLPDPRDDAFTRTPTGRQKRTNISVLYEQEVRRRWRSLALAIKAKLVAVADGVCSFEAEFLPYMVTNDGQTVAQKMLPMIEQATMGGGISPLLLTAGTEDRRG